MTKYLTSILLYVFSTAIIHAQEKKELIFSILLDQPVQEIRNIGTSGCWFTEEIGATWPAHQKKRIAELLFSKSFDKDGQLKGIGLSAFRYNIGAGTTEQGDNSGIKEPSHRVESFLSPEGKYDWSKQKGYTWMLQQAKNYGVENFIAFSNSPPVQFTKNGLGFKLTKDSLSNLREDKYEAFAAFMADVVKHFDQAGLHFNYISPVNEPQWDWSGTMGEAKQEGTPWTNEETYKITKALNNSLASEKLKTKILLTEAAKLDFLYKSNLTNRSRQISSFWDPKSNLYVGGLSHTTPYVEGHSYFTDEGDASMINIRRSLRDSLKKYKNLEYWQSEYSLLGNGYRDGKMGRLAPIDYALFLAKIIHHDLVIGNATAWHFWNAYEPGAANSPRYYLIAMNRNRTPESDTLFTITKNLWALGHYSRFIRPGMVRVETKRSDGLADTSIAKNIMISAFKDKAGKNLVVNIINYTNEEKEVALELQGAGKWKLIKNYVTSGKDGDDLKPYPLGKNKHTDRNNMNSLSLPPRSICTFIFST